MLNLSQESLFAEKYQSHYERDDEKLPCKQPVESSTSQKSSTAGRKRKKNPKLTLPATFSFAG